MYDVGALILAALAIVLAAAFARTGAGAWSGFVPTGAAFAPMGATPS
ncbi:MAG: hypothetical protein ACLQPH_13345 [Acidimicrobiales bacterium]